MSKGKTDEISRTLVPDFHYSFKFTESDSQTNSYLLISYDSKTRLLKSLTDLSGTNVSEKAINDADDNELSNSIRSNRDDFLGQYLIILPKMNLREKIKILYYIV